MTVQPEGSGRRSHPDTGEHADIARGVRDVSRFNCVLAEEQRLAVPGKTPPATHRSVSSSAAIGSPFDICYYPPSRGSRRTEREQARRRSLCVVPGREAELHDAPVVLRSLTRLTRRRVMTSVSGAWLAALLFFAGAAGVTGSLLLASVVALVVAGAVGWMFWTRPSLAADDGSSSRVYMRAAAVMVVVGLIALSRLTVFMVDSLEDVVLGHAGERLRGSALLPHRVLRGSGPREARAGRLRDVAVRRARRRPAIPAQAQDDGPIPRRPVPSIRHRSSSCHAPSPPSHPACCARG